MKKSENLENIIKAAKNEKMNEKEKSIIRLSILKYMEKNPLKEKNSETKPSRAFFTSLATPSPILFFLKKPIARYTLLAALVIFISGTGISFAAKNSLPGDFLYPVKTNFNEKIYYLSLMSEEKKMEYNINLVETRFKEAKTMLEKGSLDKKVSSNIQLLINKHIKEANARAIKISAKNNKSASIGIKSNLEAILKANFQILSGLSDKKMAKDKEFDNFLININLKANEVGKDRQIEETRLSEISPGVTIKDAEKKLAKAITEIDYIKKDFERKKQTPDLFPLKRIEENIKNAEEYIVNGKKKIEEKDYVSALILFQNSLRTTMETKIYLSHEEKLNIIKNDYKKNKDSENLELENKKEQLMQDEESRLKIEDKLDIMDSKDINLEVKL